jgi:hypothetical protein
MRIPTTFSESVAPHPSGKGRHGSATRSSAIAHREDMTTRKAAPKVKALKARKTAAKKLSPKKPAAPKTAAPPAASKVQPLRSKNAEIHRVVHALTKIATPAPKKPTARKAPKLQVEKVTVTARAINPTTAAALDQAWITWTGSKPGHVHHVEVAAAKVRTPFGVVHLPSRVVFLGRVTKLITPSGEVKDFGDSGPHLVSDAALKSLWLLSSKPHRFHLEDVSLIAYLAKKPKFGDRGVVEYVHAFEGPTQAAMAGQVGLLRGPFRLTPRGIEG